MSQVINKLSCFSPSLALHAFCRAITTMSSRRFQHGSGAMVAETRKFISRNIKEFLDELETDMIQRFRLVQNELIDSLNKALGESSAAINVSLTESHKSQMKTLENKKGILLNHEPQKWKRC